MAGALAVSAVRVGAGRSCGSSSAASLAQDTQEDLLACFGDLFGLPVATWPMLRQRVNVAALTCGDERLPTAVLMWW